MGMAAYHDPKKYPKTAADVIRTVLRPNDPLSAAEMARTLEGLVGDYGEIKPPEK